MCSLLRRNSSSPNNSNHRCSISGGSVHKYWMNVSSMTTFWVSKVFLSILPRHFVTGFLLLFCGSANLLVGSYRISSWIACLFCLSLWRIAGSPNCAAQIETRSCADRSVVIVCRFFVFVASPMTVSLLCRLSSVHISRGNSVVVCSYVLSSSRCKISVSLAVSVLFSLQAASSQVSKPLACKVPNARHFLPFYFVCFQVRCHRPIRGSSL